LNSQQLQSNPSASTDAPRKGSFLPYRTFVLLAVILVGVFCLPLGKLLQRALGEDSLYSYVLLIPFVSAYFIWQKRKGLARPVTGFVWGAIPFALAGAAVLITAFFIDRSGHKLSTDDTLFFSVGSFVLFIFAVCVYGLGPSLCRQILFPLGFFAFITPFPDVVITALESASKHASAETYAFLMKLAGIPYFRQGLVFVLPNLNIEVAQECSGIRSSLVLFITSLIAGYFFLSRPRNRALLAFIVVPLGILRNAFRIMVLSYLTVYWDSRVIDSPLHHRGGPVFFAISLIPFLLLLALLIKSEKIRKKEKCVPSVC
jgi:exosortase C (VPDSG-CTERM-specific)